MMKKTCLILSVAMALSATLPAKPAPYDPLGTAAVDPQSVLLTVKDPERDRSLPLRVYLPDSQKPEPVILFSHGLGGSRDNNAYLGNHWAKSGYVAVFIQHPGSDESVWKPLPRNERVPAMKKAASGANALLRSKDVPSVIDAITRWNADPRHPLHQRLDLENIGMSGYSFGAVTTQWAAGQVAGGGRISFAEPRIRAALMLSPSPPAMGDPARAFASIRIPCLLMTGTLDHSPIGNHRAEDRLKVFPHLKQAPAWQVVFDKATHASFGDHTLRGGAGNKHHRAIQALSTAFWDFHLRGEEAAGKWLNGPAARSVLDPDDRWETRPRPYAATRPGN